MKASSIMEAKLQGNTAVAVITIVVAVIAIVATVIVVKAVAMDLPKATITVGVIGGRRVIF